MQRGHPGFAVVVALTFVATFTLALVGAKVREQTPGQPAISDALSAHVRNERFVPVTSLAALPAGVRDAMTGLFGGKLEMAEPGAPFQATDVISMPRLPFRRLVLAGCSADHCLVYYEKGGFAHLFYALVFQTSTAGTIFEFGGTAPNGLADLDAVKTAVASGRVLGQAKTNYW